MKTRLQRIEIRNFKAFRDFSLNLEGRHLLVYGDNGAGKSSLYWALYTFLQSARKPRNSISKYFDPGHQENLLNIHEQTEAAPQLGQIAVTLLDTETSAETTYRISQADHETFNVPAIARGDLASDFITYRFFFGFSDFKNSEKFDLWPLFEQEILPFCVSTGGLNPQMAWDRIKHENPNPGNHSGIAGTAAFDTFHENTAAFAAIVPGIVDSISTEAQKFYDRHFAENDPAKVTLKLGVTTPPASSGKNLGEFQFTKPVLEFGIMVAGKVVYRPQAFLNEAKLTQLALSVRFAASVVNLHTSDLKLLVLDDLLVSLDMSNRIKVVEILLSAPSLANYQKVILTHDLGFFREFRRTIGSNHTDWAFVRLVGKPSTQIDCQREKTELQRAEDYLRGHCLDEAAICLRKAADDMAKRYREWATRTKIPPGDFFTLTENLRAARNKLLEKIPMHVYEKVIQGTAVAQLDHIVPNTETDIDSLPGLALDEKGKLKTSRRRLRELITNEHWLELENVKLIDEVLKTTERVLNPGAHGGDAPLYEHEVQKALDLLNQLELVVP